MGFRDHQRGHRLGTGPARHARPTLPSSLTMRSESVRRLPRCCSRCGGRVAVGHQRSRCEALVRLGVGAEAIRASPCAGARERCCALRRTGGPTHANAAFRAERPATRVGRKQPLHKSRTKMPGEKRHRNTSNRSASVGSSTRVAGSVVSTVGGRNNSRRRARRSFIAVGKIH